MPRRRTFRSQRDYGWRAKRRHLDASSGEGCNVGHLTDRRNHNAFHRSQEFCGELSAGGLGRSLAAVLWVMADGKRFVYIIQSIDRPAAYYVGLTSDVEARLTAHNAGASPHTAANRPWRRLVVVEFDEEQPAALFEKYLKTGSGREFARRHFRQEISE